MRRIMVDIETLSTHTSNSVVLSVGAVEFQLGDDRPTIHMGHEWVLPIGPQIALGREISQGTLDFWKRQPREAIAAWAEAETTPIERFLDAFKVFLEDRGPYELWAHGVCFDMGNIEGLYQQYGAKAPWPYDSVRDARTISRLFPARLGLDGPAGVLVPHMPLADCTMQIHDLWSRGIIHD